MARKSFAKLPESRLHPTDEAPKKTRADDWKQRLIFAIGPTIFLAMGVTVVASAQSNSPFANKKKVQAWELPESETPDSSQVNPSQTNQQPRRTQQSAQPTVGNLQLRSRRLDPDTVTAPPPGKPPKRIIQAPVAQSSQAQTSQTYSAQSSQMSAPTQSVPSPNYTYSPSNSVPTATISRQPSSPYGSPQPVYPRGSQSAGSNYANVPRGSVTGIPSQAMSDETDWTVHELPSSNRPYPAPPYRAQSGQQAQTLNPYEGNAPSGNWGQYQSQSNNPTAYDYGYRRPGEPLMEGTPSGYSDPYSAQNTGQPSQQSGAYRGPAPARKRGFFDRIGLTSLATLITGRLRGGVAGREQDGWEEAFIGDADVEVEISAVTQGGLEWGIHGQGRAQYDEGRKGFTRRLPDCPPTLAGCASITVPGNAGPTSVRGHTSQFYTFGPDVAKDTQVALESAHIFLRSAYGDVTVGRDDGSAYLFSLGAPTLLNVGASNSGVDYTGLDVVKTVNDASGFSEKITYTTPRLLGDQVGVGIQLGVSYAPDADACGVDYCVDLNDIENVVAPDIADVIEAGIALDRTFAPGVSVEATATYARGTEQSGLMGLDDLQAFGAGLEFRMRDWTVGGSYLNSNQGLMNGDYEAYDVGLTWKPSAFGFTLGYGHATDDLVTLTSDQFVGGLSYDINERIRLGAGVQYSDRESLRNISGTAQTAGEKATAVFIEGGITF